MRVILCCVAFGCLSVAGLVPSGAPIAAEQRIPRVIPTDQAETNAAFREFRDRLRDAVDRKDAAFIAGILASEVKLSVEGAKGADEFLKEWRPEAPDSPLWPVLADILRLGGAFKPDGSFVAPYVHAHFPPKLDAIMSLVVISTGVAVRKEPRPDAAVLTRISYEIVTAEPWRDDVPAGWVKVKASGGHVGYVASELVRSPIGYRAGFARRGGQWRMIFLLAGD